MKILTGKTYQENSSKFGNILLTSKPKIGKTAFIITQILGVFPKQEYGLVTKPEHLHIFSFDTQALMFIDSFITKLCKKPEGYLDYKVYNFEEDVKKVFLSDAQLDYTLFDSLKSTILTIINQIKPGEIHALAFSSLTGMAEGLKRSIAGAPKRGSSGSSMDPNKWQAFDSMISELRGLTKSEKMHTFWEGHEEKTETFSVGANKDSPVKVEEKLNIHVPGSAGRNFAFNVGHHFTIMRNLGNKITDTGIEEMYINTVSSANQINSGRGVTQFLNPREFDLVKAFEKMGFHTGKFKL